MPSADHRAAKSNFTIRRLYPGGFRPLLMAILHGLMIG
jgi:hypothetical protein